MTRLAVLSVVALAVLLPLREASARSCEGMYRLLQQEGLDVPKSGRLHLIVNLGIDGDPEVDESLADAVPGRFRQVFPGESVVYLHPRSLKDLKERLDSIGASGMRVASLVVMGHSSYRHFTLTNGDARIPFSFATMREYFKGLRYAPDASAVFSGCKLISETPENSIRELADLLGIRSGRVYANEEMGYMFRDMVVRQPFHVYGWDWKSAAVLSQQLLSPGFYPIGLAMEQGLNGGKTLVRVPGKKDCIEDGHLIDYLEDKLFRGLPYSRVTPEELARIEPQSQAEADASEVYDDPAFYESLEMDGSYNEDVNAAEAY